MLSELERAAHQRSGRVWEFDFPGNAIEVILTVVLREFRLWIQQVHLTWSTIHKQVDDGLCTRRMMRPCSRQSVSRGEDVLVQQTRQRSRRHAGCDISE
jgi:hypothetical protein